MKKNLKTIVCFLLSATLAQSADWTTFGGNADHSFVAGEALNPPLKMAWTYRAAQAPSPGFRNGYAEPQLTDAIAHDFAFHPVISGDKLYFGSSTEEGVICLDTKTGEEKWVFHTNGAVRISPTVEGGKLYFGSDDGYVYCLSADTGALKWKSLISPKPRQASIHGRIGNAWPINSGPYLHHGVLYCFAGFFPPQGVFLHALNPETGAKLWSKEVLYAPNGQMLVDGETIWAPTGRTAPAEFKTTDGTPQITVPAKRRAFGGSIVQKIGGDLLAWGHNEWDMTNIRYGNEEMQGVNKSYLDGIPSGTMDMLECISLTGDAETLYIVRKNEVWAVSKKKFTEAAKALLAESGGKGKKKGAATYSPHGITAGGADILENDGLVEALKKDGILWNTPIESRVFRSLLSGQTLYLGGKNQVIALDAKTGKKLWSSPVEGEAYGLAVANGAFYASTDQGKIYCFTPQGGGKEVAPKRGEPFSPSPKIAEYAAFALEKANVKKGFCFVVGIESGALMAEIARKSDFFVVGVERDEAKAKAAREKLREAGLYGRRAVVHHQPESKLDYAIGLGNIVLSEEALSGGNLPYEPESILNLVQPYGGIFVVSGLKGEPSLSNLAKEGFSKWEKSGDFAFARRGALAGAGEWTTVYADLGNTCSSGDALIGPEIELQWVGPPGTKDSPDRHNVAQTPLSKAGYLLYPCLDQSLQAIDIYNGTIRWRIQAPLSVRQMMSHNAGGICAGEEKLFMASEGSCWEIAYATGEKRRAYEVPDKGKAWGYTAAVGDILIGSTQSMEAAKGATVKTEAQLNSYFVAAGDYRSNPTFTDHLFALNHKTQSPLWSYQGGLILHPTLCIGDGLLYFAETKNPKAAIGNKGILELKEFFADAFLVALDIQTGKEKWRKKLDPLTQEANMMMYLAYKDGVLVSYRSYYADDFLTYETKGIQGTSGGDLWKQNEKYGKKGAYKPLRFGKNGFSAHPVILSGKVCVLPQYTGGLLYTYDLKTGERDKDQSFAKNWVNKGCSPPSASSKMLFFRDTSTSMFDITTRKVHDMTRVTRPACWFSVIPAGGVVVNTEMGAYCTCGNAYQISSGFSPKK